MNLLFSKVKIAFISILTAAILTVSLSTQAALLNVKEIEITNALGTWLQISELAATGSGNNAINLTTNATVSATSSYQDISTYFASRAVDGSDFSFYHGDNGEGEDTFRISFNQEIDLATFSLRSRYDNLGANLRDVYNVVFKDENGNILYELNHWDGRLTENEIAKQNNGLLTTDFASIMTEVPVPATEVPIPAAALLLAPALFGLIGLQGKLKKPRFNR